jgi:hypothetical protein
MHDRPCLYDRTSQDHCCNVTIFTSCSLWAYSNLSQCQLSPTDSPAVDLSSLSGCLPRQTSSDWLQVYSISLPSDNFLSQDHMARYTSLQNCRSNREKISCPRMSKDHRQTNMTVQRFPTTVGGNGYGQRLGSSDDILIPSHLLFSPLNTWQHSLLIYLGCFSQCGTTIIMSTI